MIPKLTDEPGAIATAGAIRAGTMSPLEAVDAAIARIEALDGPINAVVVRDFDRARDAARALDGMKPGEDQPLFGLPMTIKEAFNIAGLPTTWGLEKHRDFVPDRDAEVVRRLKRAGAIFVGKTNVPPFLSDWQSSNPVYGATGNPFDLSASPGGSSGGSAAALAAGMVAAEFGSDIGGSIRVPAHFCGLWGHKPTWGAIDSHGHDIPGTESHGIALGTVGPMARTAEDLALLLQLTLDRPQTLSGKNLADCHFLLLTEHPSAPTDTNLVQAIDELAAEISRAGARVDRHSELLPDLAEQHETYVPMLEIAMKPQGPGRDGQAPSLLQWYHFLNAQAANQRRWATLFETYDFVLAPPFSRTAFPHDNSDPYHRNFTINGEEVTAVVGLAWPGVATFPGLPATALPIGQAEGLPCGMQVMGPAWRDRDCIAMAAQIGELLD